MKRFCGLLLILGLAFPAYTQDNNLCFQCRSSMSCSFSQAVGGCVCDVECTGNSCSCTICGTCYAQKCVQFCNSASTAAQAPDPGRWWSANVASELISQVSAISPVFGAFLDSHKGYFRKQEAKGRNCWVTDQLLQGKFSGIDDQKELDWKLDSVRRGDNVSTTWTYWLSTQGDEPNILVISVDRDNVSWTLKRDNRPAGQGAFQPRPLESVLPQAGGADEGHGAKRNQEPFDPNQWWRAEITSALISQVRAVSPLFAALLDDQEQYLLKRARTGAPQIKSGDRLRGILSGVGDQKDLDWKLESVERHENQPTKWTYWLSTRGDEPNRLVIIVYDGDVNWTLSRDKIVKGSGSVHSQLTAPVN
jgi:hypothetical protein